MHKRMLGIIPARGNSKGLPNKNIVDLGGKPVIAYTILEALKSNLDRVILSSEDKDIINISKEYGIEVPFIRPRYLSTDEAHTQDVIEHAVNWLEKNENYYVDSIMTLQPTSPLRRSHHINKAIEIFNNSNTNSLMSIYPIKEPPWWILRKNKDKINLFLNDVKNPFNLERQQFEQLYRGDGSIFITKRDYLKNNNTLFDFDNCSYIEMDEKESIQLDTPIDLEILRSMYKF